MMSSNETRLLYITIYLVTVLFGALSQGSRNGRVQFHPVWLFFSLLVHWFFLAFTNIGTDYEHYIRNIEYSADEMSSFVEFGFNGICYILYTITKSAHITLFLVKTIEIVLLYYGFFLLRYKVSLWISIFAYNAIIYLQGINLVSMHFGIILLFLSFIHLWNYQNKQSLIFLLAACTVHSSAVLIVPIYLLYYSTVVTNKKISVLFIALMLVGTYFLISIYDQIFSYAISHISVFEQYSNYTVISSTGSGMMQVFYFLPIFVVVFFMYFHTKEENYKKNIAIVFTLVAFAFAILGYRMEVFARINMNFLGLYSAMVPSILFSYRNKRKDSKYTILVLFWLGVMLVRCYFVLRSNMDPASDTGVEHYRFYSP